MSVSVISQSYDTFEWDINKKKKIYTLKKDATIVLYLDYKGENRYFKFSFKKGFKCDGLSVPSCFNWFLKGWDDNNMLYNLAGVVHDGLYGNKGFKLFSRDESDAIFRGLLRASGMNRFHASTADFMLGLFARKHWGDDDLKSANLVTCEEI